MRMTTSKSKIPKCCKLINLNHHEKDYIPPQILYCNPSKTRWNYMFPSVTFIAYRKQTSEYTMPIKSTSDHGINIYQINPEKKVNINWAYLPSEGCAPKPISSWITSFRTSQWNPMSFACTEATAFYCNHSQFMSIFISRNIVPEVFSSLQVGVTDCNYSGNGVIENIWGRYCAILRR